MPMSWLDRFKKPNPLLDDPAFGRVEFERRYGCWSGSVSFGPEPQTVLVTLYGDAPTNVQRERFKEFEARYSDLAPAIASELFDLYKPYLEQSLEEGKNGVNGQNRSEDLHRRGVGAASVVW